ncbi:ATP-binding protein [Phenylobacterium sp.]|uniref:sensor histidine kinase n=1 Tax=Phenylobacterium sp. TaxID=1871053 RepID=UPI0025E09364|nr:ATP-binding protein [Phenylobacterium sp.]
MWWSPARAREAGRERSFLRQVLRYAAVAPIIAAATGIAELFYRLTGSDRLSGIFLAGVLLAAFLLGSGPAYVAAGLAFVVYFYWVDPRFQFTFGSPEDFNVLMVFLAVSTLTGLLTGRVRDEAARAKARQRLNAILFEASREFSASSDEAHIRERLVGRLAEAAHGEAVVSDGAAMLCAPDDRERPDLTQRLLHLETRADAAARTAGDDGWRLRPLRAGSAALGAAAWRPAGADLSDDELTLVEILVDTGAAAIARARLAAGKAEAEARARTEHLRDALLSSISHDLRTPLAAILASATSLEAFGGSFDGETRQDLLATIREEAERLDGVVANLLNMSRLEAGALTLQAAAFNVPEVVRRVLERRRCADKRHVSTEIDPRTPEAIGDPVLFEQALGNVVDNALRYAPLRSPLSIVVRHEDPGVVVEVWDEGPGVRDADTERVFEKFYRAPEAAQTQGTGLGLAITRGLLTAMDGEVCVQNRRDGVTGLVVRLRLQAAGA